MGVTIKGPGPVVVVDDDPDFHRIVAYVFRESKVSNPLTSLGSGREFLDLMDEWDEEAEEARCPSLVLLDINMPDLDGIETLTRMRAIERFKEVPVVAMLSSSDEESDMRRAREAGANDYFVKPSGLADFVSLFDSFVSGT